MAQFSKQFAIINKLKSLVKKTGKMFNSKPDAGITEEIARKIQKSAYDLSHRKEKDSYTPPYLMIADQLQVSDDQIFCAAVYNLSLIALNEDKNAAAIIEILEKCIAGGGKSKEQNDYMKSKIEVIKRGRNKKG